MKKLFLALSILVVSFSSCKKNDPEPAKPVSEQIVGHWKTGNQYLQNHLVASADGSYLEFNNSGSQPYHGKDHKASDNSTGTFTWKLQNSDTEILFSDTTAVGGAWNGTYQIESINDSKLVIKTNSILGEYKCELNK